MITQPQDIDTYWTKNNIVLGEGKVERANTLIRMRLHRSTEKYFTGERLIKLSAPRGERVYVHAKPYILIPDITLTIAAYPRAAKDGAIGEVIGSHVKKLKPREIGNAQAWYYPTDRIIMLWECYLTEQFQSHPEPQHDTTLATVWTGFEKVLRVLFPKARRMVTPWLEPIYQQTNWQAFLKQQGYTQNEPGTLQKHVQQKE